jgi:hypothetical protein
MQDSGVGILLFVKLLVVASLEQGKPSSLQATFLRIIGARDLDVTPQTVTEREMLKSNASSSI